MPDLNGNYGSFKSNEEGGSSFKSDADVPYRTFLFPISLDLRFTTSPEARMKPYFYVGGGALIWDLWDESDEDFDNFQDDDGAPESDNDGDGILDTADKCPGTDETVSKGTNTKENYNGYQDDDCPDKKPMQKLEKKGAKLILKNVNFETASSAALTKESYAILDEVIPGLKDNKEVELEIRGYTNSQGAVSYNQKLSERRANTVMEYLINNGIEASRFRTVGYGEKDPIAFNSTSEGHAQNRRIEFVKSK